MCVCGMSFAFDKAFATFGRSLSLSLFLFCFIVFSTLPFATSQLVRYNRFDEYS